MMKIYVRDILQARRNVAFLASLGKINWRKYRRNSKDGETLMKKCSHCGDLESDSKRLRQVGYAMFMQPVI